MFGKFYLPCALLHICVHVRVYMGFILVRSQRRKEKDAQYAERIRREREQAERRAALPPPPCIFFAKGRCRAGEECPFYHDPTLSENGHLTLSDKASDLPTDMCKYYLAGCCEKGIVRTAVHLLGNIPCSLPLQNTSLHLRLLYLCFISRRVEVSILS